MISCRHVNRKIMLAGALLASFALAGCAVYPAGYGDYAWDYAPAGYTYGYGPAGYTYGYGVDYWPGYYNGVLLGGVSGGYWWGSRSRHHWRGWNGWAGGWHGNRVARHEFRGGVRHLGAPAGGSFAAQHGGIGKFGARVGGGGRVAAGGIGGR